MHLIHPKTLTISIYANFYPVSYKRKTFAGLDVEIMKLFAKAEGLTIHFKERYHFENIWLDPIHGKSDVSIGGIGTVPSRMNPALEWTMPYFHVQRTLVFNKSDPLRMFPRDVTRTILGTYNSTGWLDSEARSKPIHKDHFMQRGTTDEEDIRRLLAGEVQGLIRGSFVGKAIVKRYPQLDMLTPWDIENSEFFAFPTRLGSGLAVSLSSFLNTLFLSGQFAKLLKKYKLD